MNNQAIAEHIENAPAIAEPTDTATALISMIERVALNPNVDIDKMERLLEMQERILARTARVAYAAALAEMQPNLPVIERRGLIQVRKKDAAGDRNGEIQQSTPYALWEDINEAIRPVLQQYGFALSFRTGQSADGRVTVTGILSHREGHQEETTMVLQHDSTGSKNAVQAIGSSTSYGKRYTAMALLNLTSRGDDDDARAAGAPMPISADQLSKLRTLIDEVGGDTAKLCAHFKIDALPDLPVARFAEAVGIVELRRQKAARA
jgi:hypothetical protein